MARSVYTEDSDLNGNEELHMIIPSVEIYYNKCKADCQVASRLQSKDSEHQNVRTDLIKVLHVINGEFYSGAERVQDNLALALPKQGFDVIFACVKPGKFPEFRHAKQSKLYTLPMAELGWYKTLRELKHICTSEGIAVLHAHTPRTAVLCSRLSRRTGLPWVYHSHSPTLRDSHRRLKNLVVGLVDWWCVRQADRIITVSESLGTYWRRLGIDSRRIITVPNGVASWPEWPQRRWPTSFWTLGTIALFRPRKGAEILLKALRQLVASGFQFKVLAVGPFETPQYEVRLKRFTEALGLGEVVQWTGFREDVRSTFLAMDLFVLPSLYGEGMPMVLLEAMASGLPVVATTVGGIPEIVRDGREGLLVPPNSANELAETISRFLVGAVDWETMGRAAFQRQRERFSLESMAAGVAAVYRDLQRSVPRQSNTVMSPNRARAAAREGRSELQT